MKSKFLFVKAAACILLVLVVVSCKKDTPQPSVEASPVQAPAPVYPSYFPFKIGNYWIYERYKVEQYGLSTSLHQFDSMYVEKDTLINTRTYFKIRWYDFIYQKHFVHLLRDSLHCTVNAEGRILFSSVDFSTVFDTIYSVDYPLGGPGPGDTLFKISTKMNDKDLVVTTAAGTFTTSNMQQTIWVYPSHFMAGVNNPRYMNHRFAKDVGPIIESEPYYLSVDYGTERRLVRFHLN